MSNSPAQLSVFFDNSCPICREEISALKSIDHLNKLKLVDCSGAQFSDVNVTNAGLSQDILKNEMHVLDANGQWHVAADAFVIMYETVGFDGAAKLLKRRGVRSLFEWVYPLFVRHRYNLRFLGIHKIMPWLIRRAAAKQAAKAQKCAIDRNSTHN